MNQVFRLFDFNVFNEKGDNNGSDDGDNEEFTVKKDNDNFMIQMFGINEEGKTCSILVEEYKPFFYIKVGDNWTINTKNSFLSHLKVKVGKYYQDSIIEAKLIQKKKLYGFDGGKEHKFVLLRFNNIKAFNQVAKLWFKVGTDDDGNYEKKLLPNGYPFANTYTQIYESNIPPLLRFFHIKEVSPSGWIQLSQGKYMEITRDNKTTTCDYEFIVSYKNVEALNNKETRVPYKIMSFDIEASSSHGDFPVPVKSYKKLATNIVDYFIKELQTNELTSEQTKTTLRQIIYNAFNYDHSMRNSIELVYPKKQPETKEALDKMIDKWIQTKVRDYKTGDNNDNNENSIEAMFEAMGKAMASKAEEGEGEEEASEAEEGTSEVDENNTFNPYKANLVKGEEYKNKASTIVDIILDTKFERNGKINELIISLKKCFPPLEGDKVTFIGSTFVKYGEPEPYLNHCIALNTCDNVTNAEIESYSSEKDVLLAWTDLVQRENPDIIIGYNIFSFDYEFLFRRAIELNCVEEFMLLSRNKGELCVNKDYKTGNYEIDKSSITLASGTYDLSMIKMTGRFQIDMYNWFRKTENLTSYKLDYVGGHFIGDVVKGLEHYSIENIEVTKVKTTNMTGLQAESYIHFEEINHSSDYYAGGKKIRVKSVNRAEGYFEVYGTETPKAKTVKWGLAKDDVSPKDIFRMTHEGPTARAVIAKYCIQDCNLVHHLFNKVDVVTDLVEMSKLCSVPMSFLVFRGQGIKLTSYVAKKCREKGTLMPVINKGSKDDGYEGAIVLEPKCGLYLDNPISVGDFASLYPSSMLSENLCPSSKVWTKIYDLAGNLVSETGEKMEIDGNIEYIYDNLPTYEYVDVKFDTYRYVRKTPKASAEKVKSGYKVCRFAQPLVDSEGKEQKAIMPSILQELLKARKDTRKLIPKTNDEFMKNVLDKRQLAYKVTANSLYGQLGAKTSTFYEPDIAASTTATGRLLLTYAKRVVEECYGDSEVDTKYGMVNTKAEYVYGDSVANYTPVYIKSNDKIDILTIEDLANKYGGNNWVKCIEPGKQDKEFCELNDVETWTEKGWTKLYRVIRHELAPEKKMVRIITNTGCVDVTDDHSLVRNDGTEVSPKDVTIGTELLHFRLTDLLINSEYQNIDIFTGHFENMLEASKYTNYLNSLKIPFKLNSGKDLSIVVVPNSLNNSFNSAIKKIDYLPDYKGFVYDLTTENHHFAAGVGNMIVHNTDSVFFTFNLANKETGEKIVGEKALELSIEIAQSACHMVSSFLKAPHDFEYEKTFTPFCLLSKKRYVGILYETDPKKGKRKEMGIVLKRRDNAPIVKDVYGGIIDILMKEQDLQKAIDYLNKCLQDLVDGKVPIEKLIITKSLNGFYKNPQQIAHKVLADRITARDPGNKPSSGDRIPFVYIVNPNKKALQGEKIETPTFIKENNLKIDYSFYITNQIMKPLLQLFGLVLEDIWKMQGKESKIAKFKREVAELKKEYENDTEKFQDKLDKLKDKEVKALLFDKYLRETNNAKAGNQAITGFFKRSG